MAGLLGTPVKPERALLLVPIGLGVWYIVTKYYVGRGISLPKPTPTPDVPKPTPGGGWADADAPRRIREIARPLEQLFGWRGLGDFLVAVAWTESRGNSQATGDGGASHGWFQLRRVSSRVGDLGMGVEALYDEPLAVALAAWYAKRLRPYSLKEQVVDWLALRRGWRFPSSVSDVQETKASSVRTKGHFSQGVSKAGLPQSFMYAPAYPPGYSWPGIDAVLSAVGRAKVS